MRCAAISPLRRAPHGDHRRHRQHRPAVGVQPRRRLAEDAGQSGRYYRRSRQSRRLCCRSLGPVVGCLARLHEQRRPTTTMATSLDTNRSKAYGLAYFEADHPLHQRPSAHPVADHLPQPPRQHDRFPIVRRRGPLALIGLSTAVPTRPGHASGEVGRVQLDRLARSLEQAGARDLFRVVLLHHPPGVVEAPMHKRLTDAEGFRAVIAQSGAELILHGHEHRFRFGELARPEGPGAGVRGTVGLDAAAAERRRRAVPPAPHRAASRPLAAGNPHPHLPDRRVRGSSSERRTMNFELASVGFDSRRQIVLITSSASGREG